MMKKHILISAILFSGLFYSQSNCDNLKTEIQSVKNENNYLRKTLEITNPILETEKNNNNFKITKVIGNKADKTISITFLIEAKDENKTMFIQDISIIDLEGNEFKVDLMKSSNSIPKLATNVPLKTTFVFKDISDQPLLIKLFRFSTRNEPTRKATDWTNSKLEFRDLKVNWN